MLEATHTCNCQDKNSSDAPLSTHMRDAMVRCYHTSSTCDVTGTAHLGVSRFLSPVQKCYLSTMQALAGTHPAAQAVLEPQNKPCPPQNLVCPQACPEVPRTVPATHKVAKGLRAHCWEWQLLLSLLSQVSMVTPFLPSPLPNTGFCLVGTTEKEQTLLRSTALTNVTLLRGYSWSHTSFLGKFA